MDLQLRPREECRFDAVSLGEIMLRFDPGEGRVRTARSFRVSEGGGEYNVVRGLHKCFGLKTAVITAFADNEVGKLLVDCIEQGGVATDFIRMVKTDGIGRSCRNGLNFTERGFGVRWLHTGGIYAALSERAGETAIAACEAAHRYGTVISYDLNYRPSMWNAIGGKARAQEVNRALARYVDVMLGNEEDFTACLGFEVPGNSESLDQLNLEGYQEMLRRGAAEFPNWKVVATTLRTVHSATVNDWKAICFADGALAFSRGYEAMEVLDRVGGGDSFASGLIYGLMTTGDPKKAVEYGAAHGALAMTTPGDTSMASVDEVEALMAGKGARVKR